MQISNNHLQNLQYNVQSDPSVAKSLGSSESLKSAAIKSYADSSFSGTSITSADAAIEQALEQAGLPKTEKNMMVARQLIENQMAVSKDNLQQLIQQSNMFREADISTLMLMNRNNIPITHFTASGLQGYIDNQQNLLNQLDGAVSEFTNLLSGDNNVEINSSILEILTASPDSLELDENITSNPANIGTTSSTEATQAEISQESANITNTDTISSSDVQKSTISGLLETSTQSSSNTQENTVALQGTTSYAFSANTDTQNLPKEFAAPLSIQEQNELSLFLKNITGKQENFEGKETLKILNTVKEAIDGKDSQAVRDLVSSPAYKQLIKKAFGEKFTLSPNEIKDANSLNEYYKSTFKSLSKMMELAQKNGDSKLAEALSKPMDNVKFMDTINNVMPFVQLPLKFENGATHGELYVFKNGRNKTNLNDVKSVLLHLDMDSLGPTDIHMGLDHNHLNLKFYCNDESSLNYLSEKIDDLAEALNSKGFEISTDFSVRETTKQPMEEALSHSSSIEPAFVYGFDTRA